MIKSNQESPEVFLVILSELELSNLMLGLVHILRVGRVGGLPAGDEVCTTFKNLVWSYD